MRAAAGRVPHAGGGTLDRVAAISAWPRGKVSPSLSLPAACVPRASFFPLDVLLSLSRDRCLPPAPPSGEPGGLADPGSTSSKRRLSRPPPRHAGSCRGGCLPPERSRSGFSPTAAEAEVEAEVEAEGDAVEAGGGACGGKKG